MKRIILNAAALSAFLCMAAETETSSSAPTPELLEQMPKDARHPSGPVTKNYRELGEKRAATIIAAEQGVQAAQQTEINTRLEGCKELLTLSFLERATYIVGVEAKLAELDGGTRTKSHNNYVTSLRRIHNHVGQADAPDVIGQSMKVLEGPGTFPEKMAQFKAQSSAGGGRMAGSNAGVLGEAMKSAAIESLKKQGIENPTGELIAAEVEKARQALVAKPGDPAKTIENAEEVHVEGEKPAIEQPKGDQRAEGQSNRRATGDTTTNSRDLVRMVQFLHPNHFEIVCAEMAKRLMQETGSQWVEIGRHLMEDIDRVFHAGQPSTDAGVVLTNGEAQSAVMQAQ